LEVEAHRDRRQLKLPVALLQLTRHHAVTTESISRPSFVIGSADPPNTEVRQAGHGVQVPGVDPLSNRSVSDASDEAGVRRRSTP
jgi:hypothetical protein